MFQLSTIFIKGPNFDSSYQQPKCLNTRPVCCQQQNYGSNNQQNYGSTGQQNYGSSGQQNYGSNNQQTYGSTGYQNYGSSAQQNYGTTGQQNYGSTGHNCPNLLCNLPLCNNNTNILGNLINRIPKAFQIYMSIIPKEKVRK